MSTSILIWIAIAVGAYLLYTWIDRRRWAGKITITGRVRLAGGRTLDVETDESQQVVLAKALAGRAEGSPDELIVTLVAVPTTDEPAIVVRIGRATVGRLSRSAEKEYMPVVRRLLAHQKLGECAATVVEVPAADAGATGIAAAEPDDAATTLLMQLDLATPDKAIPRGTFEAETAAS
jgi:hypothetical protein